MIFTPPVASFVLNDLTWLRFVITNPKVIKSFSHTVFPETDSVSVLKAYALKNGETTEMNLVTGEKRNLYDG
jgi:hypothetical protein